MNGEGAVKLEDAVKELQRCTDTQAFAWGPKEYKVRCANTILAELRRLQLAEAGLEVEKDVQDGTLVVFLKVSDRQVLMHRDLRVLGLCLAEEMREKLKGKDNE